MVVNSTAAVLLLQVVIFVRFVLVYFYFGLLRKVNHLVNLTF